MNEALRAWYEPRAAAYPWRSRPTSYRVLVSEVMLQQTQASRVVPEFRAFLRRFPSVRALSAAPLDEVLRAWSGLGYDRRAVWLHRAARAIVDEHGGRLPRDVEALRALPGVGSYTAAAVASIAFGEPVPALDVNVGRVVARFRLGREVHEEGSDRVLEAASAWIDRDDPGAWNQALMDLGREVCRPTPRCAACPLAPGCAFRRAGRRPARAPRRQDRFEGSFRQVRGRVLAVLRERGSASLGSLEAEIGDGRVARAVRALADDGLVSAGPAALAGRASGRVRLGSIR
ncbi:MAG TPA: A/G-specific adenine glycosylase [Actinomycetota bacterium]